MNQLSPSLLQQAPSEAPSREAQLLRQARDYLFGQSHAIASLGEKLGTSFAQAVSIVLARKGRLVVCGMGKSGLIGRKIAATLSSTGTPSFFLHASEALHGDLGMVTRDDTVMMISNSGETEEVVRLLRPLQEIGVPVIGFAGNPECTLARLSDVFLSIAVEREACPLNLAPTTSTLVTLALGDALAMALSQERGFRPDDFARCHPGGSLGRRLCTQVRDVMRKNELPIVRPEQSLRDVICVMTEGRCGTAVVVSEGKLRGIITDGDLRRAFQKHDSPMNLTAREVMSRDPLVIRDDALYGDADDLMQTKRIKVLIAVTDRGAVSGILEAFAK